MLLAHARARLVAATLEDVAGVRWRPNVPGTAESSNWSRRLPLSVEALRRDRRARIVARALGGPNSD